MDNMTLDEAIIHCEEVADRCDVTDGNIKCANEHRQLAGWLKDYKRLLKENEKNTGKDIAIAFQFGMALGFAKKCDECDKIDNRMTKEEQISNGFTEMMKGFWNNQELEVPNVVVQRWR